MHSHVYHGMHVERNEHMWLHVRSHESFSAFNPCQVSALLYRLLHTELLFV